jgi:dUTP pyrophosphatase
MERIRGFEVVSYATNKDIIMPRRNTKYSAGYDIYNNTGSDIHILPKNVSEAIPTYLKSYMLSDEVLKIYIRSSLGFKLGVNIRNNVAIIDKDYYNNSDNEGHIFIKFVNHSDKLVILPKNTAIAQGIFQKYLITDDDETSSSGNERVGGVGSTDVKL